MDGAQMFRQVAATVNKAVLPLLGTSVGRRLLSRSFAVVTYTGRKSGRQITVPVNYRRDSDGDVVVHVMAPDAKTWWRNFTGEGASLRLRIGSDERTGHGTATRSDSGAVAVRVTLD